MKDCPQCKKGLNWLSACFSCGWNHPHESMSIQQLEHQFNQELENKSSFLDSLPRSWLEQGAAWHYPGQGALDLARGRFRLALMRASEMVEGEQLDTLKQKMGRYFPYWN